MSEDALISQRNMRDWYLARIQAAGGVVGERDGVSWGHLDDGLSPKGSGTVLPFPDARAHAALLVALAFFQNVGTAPWTTLGPPLCDPMGRQVLKSLGFEYQFAGLCMVLGAGGPDREPNNLRVPDFEIRDMDQISLGSEATHPSYGKVTNPAAQASIKAANVLARQKEPAYRLIGAFVGDTLVGTIALFATKASVGIYDLATLPGYRRRGIAAALLSAGIAASARAYADRPVILQCDASLEAFYQRHGFARCGWIEHWAPDAMRLDFETAESSVSTDLEDLAVAIETADVDRGLMLLAARPGLATRTLPGNGGGPLHWAAYRGGVELAEALIQTGAPVDMRDARYGASPLQWALIGLSPDGPAFKSGQLAVARSLIAAGAQLQEVERAIAATLSEDDQASLFSAREVAR